MKLSLKISFCGVATAMSVILMFFGGVSYVFAYAIPMITCVFSIMLTKTFGRGCAFTSYFATSLLSFFLVSDKECMLLYALFFGYYPIICTWFSKIKPKAAQIIAKYLFFNLTMLAIQLLLVYVFGIPFETDGFGVTLVIIFAVGLNLLFFIYDKMIVQMEILYRRQIEKRIKKYLH